MDRYSGYESMLTRVEQKKVQMKGQLAPEQSHLVDDLVVFVLDQVNECCNVVTVDATTDTAEDHLLSGSNGSVARAFADDTRVDVSEHANTVNPQVDHQPEAASGSISNEQSVSPPSPSSVTQSTIPANIEVKVEDESNGQSVQLCEWIKKEEDGEDDYEAQLFHCCDCGGEGCEECKVKREIKEEIDESGFETELGGNSGLAIEGYTRVKQEEVESDGEGERPYKIQPIDRVLMNEPVGSPSRIVIPTNVECGNDQVATASTSPITIEASSGQSVQHFKCVKKEEEDGGEYVMECDCEDCETCRVKIEMKEELDESGSETELGGNSGQAVQGFTRVKKEELEGELEGERPNKMQRIDRALGNGPVGSSSPSPIVIVANVEGPEMSTSSTHTITIEDHTQTCQPVTVPLPIVTPPSSSSSPHVNETLRDESLNAQPIIDNVGFELRTEEFDREQVDHDNNSTFNPVNIDQVDEETEVIDNQNDDMQVEEDGDEANENREDPSARDEPKVPAESFLKRIEPDELGNKFECNYQACGKRMKSKQNLISHIRTHTGEKPFKCTVNGCDRAFTQKVQLRVHLNTHSGTRPFVCTWPRCDARFGNKGNLTKHFRTHTGERPFECDLCDATFTQQAHLATHRRTHTGERPFECDQCDATFTQQAHLVTHRRTHTGERPFECDQCDAIFIQHTNLVTHLRTHTGARPFVCTWPECGQAFFTSTHLKTHSIVHSNERLFACDARGCTKVYKHMCALRRHQMDKHN